MAQVRIENFRDGEWRERGAGEMEISAEALAARLPEYAEFRPARAFLDGVLVAKAQPKAKGRKVR